MNTIRNINIALTNRCNLKCCHCSIWKEQPKKDIPLSFVKKILSSEIVAKNVDITLTGGEPFLHKNYLKIIKLILQYKSSSLKTISTNGTLTKKILKFFKDFESALDKDFSLHISLDGIKSHDRQRGKSLHQIKKTITLLKTSNPRIKLKLKFTITPLNYRDIISTYNYAKENNIGFKIKLIENAPNYTNKAKAADTAFSISAKKTILNSLAIIYARHKKEGNTKEALFIKKSAQALSGSGKKPLCKAPFERIFVMADGEIYSCIHFDKIGNIRNEELDDIWQSKKSTLIRRKVAKTGCSGCVSYHGSQ